MLWSLENLVLYNLIVCICDEKGNLIDGYWCWIGICSIEFKGEDGFWLNGKFYEVLLIGVNWYQDFVIVGNVVFNSIYWWDVKKLRDVGMKVICNVYCL